MNILEGKSAVITGGNSGIGLAKRGNSGTEISRREAYVFITGRRHVIIRRLSNYWQYFNTFTLRTLLPYD